MLINYPAYCVLIGLALPLVASAQSPRDQDGQIYPTGVMLDGRLWITQNLILHVTDSYCYDDKEANCTQYGRLYTWEAANKACPLLGEGWRLPSNAEWREMAKQYGGVVEDAEDRGKAAYQALLEEGSAGFKALLGGGRDPDGTYRRLDAHGFYWSDTEHGSARAWFYNFGKGAQLFNRHNDGEKSWAFSVRCIKDSTSTQNR